MKKEKQKNIPGTNPEEINQKNKNSAKWIFRIGTAAIVLTVMGVVLFRIFARPNRSPEACGKAAFEAIYSCDFEDFLEATIYNEACQKELGMDASEDIALMEAEFDEMADWMKQTGETYRVTGVKAETFDALEEEYKTGVTLFSNIYGIRDSNIVEVAKVTLSAKSSYTDDDGKTQAETFDEMYWCFQVDGKWYAFPMLGE